jgi:hypothetical protein
MATSPISHRCRRLRRRRRRSSRLRDPTEQAGKYRHFQKTERVMRELSGGDQTGYKY